jgi:hypothetical protein
MKQSEESTGSLILQSKSQIIFALVVSEPDRKYIPLVIMSLFVHTAVSPATGPIIVSPAVAEVIAFLHVVNSKSDICVVEHQPAAANKRIKNITLIESPNLTF